MFFWCVILTSAIAAPEAFCQTAAIEKIHVTDSVDYAIPAGSPVKFASIGQYNVANFSGRFNLNGTYHYGYVTDNPEADAKYGTLFLFFVPDHDILVQLPYWDKQGKIDDLEFANSKEFVAAVIPKDKLKQLQEKNLFSISGRASVLVEGYQISIECDHATSLVKFIKVNAAPSVLASHNLISPLGC